MPTHFLGRDELVEELVTRLVTGNTLSLSAEGLAGVGKTTLAVALAHHRRLLAHFKDGVLWAGLGPQPDVLGALATWADALGKDVSHLVEAGARAQAIRNAIGQRRLLLVIDDVWQEDMADLMKCGGPSCCHLLTTRDQDIAQDFAGAGGATSVPVLDEEQALELLQALAPRACKSNPETARELVKAVGGLPLAVELLGGYLAATKRSAFRNQRDKIWAEVRDSKRRLELASRRLGAVPGSPQVKLRETIELSLTDLPSEIVQAFYALGAFAPKPEQFTLEAAEAVTGADEDTLALLVARNLLEVVDEVEDTAWLALHQTLADVANASMDTEATMRHRDYYLALVERDREEWQTIETNYGQVKWVWSRLPEDESVLAFVWALRVYQTRKGLWRDHVTWLTRGLAIAEATERREDTAPLLNNLGWVYSALGQKQQALDYYQRALPIAQEIGDRAGEAITLNNIGGVYDALGQQRQALDYYQRALPIAQEVDDRAGEAATLNNIGSVYSTLGQPQQALDYYQRALPIAQEVGDRAGEAATLNNIGSVYSALGQQQQALDYYQRALPILQEVGDRAVEATTLNNIGSVYSALGQKQQALDYYQRALPIRQEVGHRAGEATTLNNIGMVYSALGQKQQALDYYQRSLPIAQEVGDRAGESVTRYNVAMIYVRQGRLAEAVAELRQVIVLREAIQHPNLEQNRAKLTQVEAMLAAQQRAGNEES